MHQFNSVSPQAVKTVSVTGEGIIVSLANSYSEAIDKLNHEDIDIVCTSYQLNTGKTGIELSREIRDLSTLF